MSDEGAILKAACDKALANPAYQPNADGHHETHCNQAVMEIATELGCVDLLHFCADEQYQIMSGNASGRWTKVQGQRAALHALDGGLAIAAMPSQRIGDAHGHVAVVYPQGMEASGSLGHDVPMLANVGKNVGVMKSSAAFPVAAGEADYFIWS